MYNSVFLTIFLVIYLNMEKILFLQNEEKYYPGRFTDHINSKQQNQPMISPPPLYTNTDHIISKTANQPMISPSPLYTNTDHINFNQPTQPNKPTMSTLLHDIEPIRNAPFSDQVCYFPQFKIKNCS